MHVVVTAGPTIEPLDDVRRLTNFSTGRLGTELARYMAQHGQTVTLLLSEQAVYLRDVPGVNVVPYGTTASLQEAFKELSRANVDAVFHAAAVSDFRFGEIWRVDDQGNRLPMKGGKVSSRFGRLFAELLPTPKVINELRDLFPDAWLVGWKYEVEGDRQQVLVAAEAQVRECRTSCCVANGPAYGDGFGLVFSGDHYLHVDDRETLFAELVRMITS